MLEISQLVWGFDRHPIGKTLSLSVPPGKLVTLVGPNGSGKTALLKTISGLLPPISGAIFIEGREISRLKLAERAALVAYLPQRDETEMEFTVSEAVAVGRFRFGSGLVQAKSDKDAVMEALAKVGLSHKAESTVQKLSGGEFQRVRLARALAQETPLIVLDEPGTHLDLAQHVQVGETLRTLCELGKTVIVASHDIAWGERFSDVGLLLSANGASTARWEEPFFPKSAIKSCFGI